MRLTTFKAGPTRLLCGDLVEVVVEVEIGRATLSLAGGVAVVVVELVVWVLVVLGVLV